MSQIQYGGRQTGSTSISGSTLDASEIPKVIPMFPRTIGAMACASMSYVFPVYVEFDMAADKPEVVIKYRLYGSYNLRCTIVQVVLQVVDRNVIPIATTKCFKDGQHVGIVTDACF
mgnify:CR=1 FL=1